jgi:hypothetical protein
MEPVIMAHKMTRYYQFAKAQQFCRAVAILAVACAGLATAQALPETHSPRSSVALTSRVLTTARSMVERYGSTTGSLYSHKTNIETTSGICQVDCSGFIAVVLKKVSPAHLNQIPMPPRRKRPLAEDFEKAFDTASSVTLPGWKKIENLSDVRPGDIMAWRLPDHAKGADTGHVFFINHLPKRETPTLWRVQILDSTKSPHFQDSRHAAQTGVGRGTLWIETDPQGHATGYHWRSPTSPPRNEPTAIGRAI